MGASAIRGWAFCILVFSGVLTASSAMASCAGMARSPVGAVHLASTGGTVPAGQLRITFVGHSTFEIESPRGAVVQTDYNDYTRRGTPHIATMNKLHDTHFSYDPDKAILHVLRGWDPAGGVARHDLRFRDIRVRNVPTNLRELLDGKLSNDNSMFVIEAVGLCVVHISHLHHYLSKDQLRELGLIDVAFAPIDGMWTMSHDELFRVLSDIRARLVIPMHYGSLSGVEAFVARAEEKWPVRRHDSDTLFVSLRTLPRKPEVVFLEGY